MRVQAAAPELTVMMNGSIVAVDPAQSPVHPKRAFVSRQALTDAESNEVLRFDVALKIRNLPELEKRFHNKEHLTEAELAAKYQPTAADYNKVADWLAGQGMTITFRDPSHLAVFASGTVKQLRKAFKVDFARITSDGVDYSSAITAPNVPASLAPVLVGVNGLQPHIRMHKHSVASGVSNIGTECSPGQVLAAYHADTLVENGYTGNDETIAIVIDSFPNTSDLSAFWSYLSIPQSLNNMLFIPVTGANQHPASGEETLDVEWASSIAPAAHIRVYGTFDLSEPNLEQAYSFVLRDAQTNPLLGLRQMSMSYGSGEEGFSSDYIQTDFGYFIMLNVAGVTCFAASGDAGSTPANGGTNENGPLQVEYPAADVNVVAVGGTSLTMTTDSNGYPVVASQTAWSNSGGGMAEDENNSGLFTRQVYQTGPGVPGGSQRAVPDVAAVADAGAVYLNGQWQSFLGTSLATPIWAGFCAILNQVHAPELPGHSSLSQLSAYLYPLIGTPAFSDITTGSNATPNSSGLYNAGPGYDMVTGIGVPNLQQLSYALSPGDEPPIVYGTAPDGAIGVYYAYSFGYGRTPSTPVFALVSGSLPPGVNMASTGAVYGTPTQLGTFSGTISATSPGGTNSFPFSISINPANFFVRHVFGSFAADGQNPNSLVQGNDGNIYGTTYAGGTGVNVVNALVKYTLGTFFQLNRFGGYNILHDFSDGTLANDGANPNPGLIQASDSSFYGSTATAGGSGSGALFKVNTSGGVTILHSPSALDGANLIDLTDGISPFVQANGNFYATAYSGGNNSGQGTAFVMTPGGNVNVLHAFNTANPGNDGITPTSLTLGGDGNFYGTTRLGGTGGYDNGTAFVMNSGGGESPIHNFSNDIPALGIYGGGEPPVGIVAGGNGIFYGTSAGAGANGYGELFSMNSSGTVTTIHNFGDPNVPNDGRTPDIAPVLGTDGNLYGTTSTGGANGNGVVYQITPSGTVNILHSFSGNDGDSPHTLMQGSDGNLYGTTYSGRGFLTANTAGIIFEIGRLAQTISFGAIPAQMVGATVNLSATASSGLTVTFQVSGPATLSNNTLTVTGTGTVSVAAIQSGNGVYLPAPTVTQTFQVMGVPGTVTTQSAVASSDQVTLSWFGVSGATSYTIGRSTTSGGPYTTVSSGNSSTTFTDFGVSDGMTYYYVISAVNSSGTGLSSPEIASTPLAQNLYWDTTTATGLANGSGAWDTQATANWSNSGAGTSNPLLTWLSGDNAFFQTAGTFTATIATGATVRVTSLTQAVAGDFIDFGGWNPANRQ